MADIARSILDAAPAQFHLVGLSMGGYVAFEILRQAPERVAKVALLDTAAWVDTPESRERRLRTIELAERGRLLEVNDMIWPLIVHPSRLADRSLRAVVDAMAEETGAEAFIRQQRALITRADPSPDLPSIRSPTLVIVGDGDAITPPERSEKIAAAIPGARLEIIAGCGHLSTLEKPNEISMLLAEWFSS